MAVDLPKIVNVRGGWAAVGHGWVVVGSSPEDAQTRYWDAERKHEEIAARPDPAIAVEDSTEPQQPSWRSRAAVPG
jgi:hypothetical protein